MTVTATLALRYILLAGFVGILALCIWLFVTRPNRQLYVIPLATWAVNGTLFYGALVLGLLPGGGDGVIECGAEAAQRDNDTGWPDHIHMAAETK